VGAQIIVCARKMICGHSLALSATAVRCTAGRAGGWRNAPPHQFNLAGRAASITPHHLKPLFGGLASAGEGIRVTETRRVEGADAEGWLPNKELSNGLKVLEVLLLKCGWRSGRQERSWRAWGETNVETSDKLEY
jgi:hypothetical protein